MKTSMIKFCYFILCAAMITALSPARAQQKESSASGGSTATQQDSAKVAKERESVEMAKRVGELENIIVYNAELFRRELNSKLVWIYVLLGVMLVASLMIYGVISQVGRREGLDQEKHDALLKELLASGRTLETQIKNLEIELKALKPPPRKAPQSKKRK
ncbi:MAG: hypothetical protein HY276_13045 [Ignavibacteriales bacterium]|nr:hypothetical protein [Ignavibacteriales bacterium]MBI3789164.1 hypothetical protein [Ignavibacteriales bacterium]